MSETSDIMVDLQSPGPKAEGGDFTKNATRAFAWFVAGIVASIIVSILMMIIGFVVGFSIDSGGLSVKGSVVPVALAAILAVGVAFASAGVVYESFVGCP